MSRPTRPPGPPYSDEPYPEEPYPDEPYPDQPYPHGGQPPPPPAGQPRFTPRPGQQPPYPGSQGQPPYPGPPQGEPPYPGPAQGEPYSGPPQGEPRPHGGSQAAPEFPPAPPPPGTRPTAPLPPGTRPTAPLPQAARPPAPPTQAIRQPAPPPPPPPPTVRATQPQAPSRDASVQPTFTPSAGGARHGRPRPSFTPREGYAPEDGRRRDAAPPPTAFFSPAPAGYQPVPVPQEYGYAPTAAPRFIPVDRRAQQDDGDSTRILERPDGELPSTGPQRAADDTSPNLARSSKAMALGTIASRGTGFLRTFVLLFVLGAEGLSGAYNNSNTLPNTVYYLMLGGIFTSVVVPLLVRAAKEDPDRGEGYAERIFTLGVVSLLTVTAIGTLLAVPLVNLYAGNITGQPGTHAAAEAAAQHHIMVIFAYFFIPQIFFYGMDSLLGAILNTRGRFGANMWTPVINNVVVIIVAGVFFIMVGKNTDPLTVSSGALDFLAIGTTLGIVVQSIALFPVLRRAGFSMRLRWDLRRYEIREIGRMAGWMFGYVATQWLGNLVVQRVANSASNTALNHHVQTSYYTIYANAWQLFQLPYAIVGISVISALLPRMSGHASERRYSLVRDDFSKGVRIASVIVVPAAIFLAVMGAPLCEFLFAHGSTNTQQARYIGEVFGVFALGLVPFMLTQLQLRVFYSFHQNRTPAVIGMVMLIVGVIGAVVVLAVLPYSQTVIGLAFAYDLVSLTGAVIAWPLLLRRVGSLDGWRITRSLVRMLIATLPGLVFIFVIIALVGSFMRQGPLYGLVVTVIGGGGALLLYAVCSRILGIEEFRTLMRSVGGRFG
jgi:putative peptidoglycan lipid II flippase